MIPAHIQAGLTDYIRQNWYGNLDVSANMGDFDMITYQILNEIVRLCEQCPEGKE